MIVDDSKLIRQRIAREYDATTFELVGTANNGFDAIELFDRASPEVVTMDLTMPELDGIECIEQLIIREPSTKILVISALNDTSIGMEALEKGAMGFITKPFSGADLKVALNEIIDS